MISGTVRDADGEPMIGATIQIQGTSEGTTVDINGNFEMEISNEDVILDIKYIGYITQQVRVGSRKQFNIILESDIQNLEEIVVVGYGTIRKSDLTGSVGTVDTDQIQKLATVDVSRSIQGKVAGVQVTTNSGAPGSGTTIRVRGIGSFGNANPLFVVDGFLTGDISNISPNDIESMEILKDASATAIYGSRGSNGVVIISTKQGLQKGIEVDFNAYVGSQSAWNTIDMLDGPTYAQAYLESVGGRISDIEPSLRYWIQNSATGTDWQEEVLQDAPIQSYDVSVRGGVEKLKYKIGASYFNQEGIVINTFGKRYQANAQVDYQILKQLSISAGVKYSLNQWTPYDQGTYSSTLGTALRKDPINPVRESSSGDWYRTNLTDLPNPARRAYEQKFRLQEAVRVQPNISIDYKIAKGLSFSTKLIWDNRETAGDFLNPSNFTAERSESGDIVRNPNESTNNIFYNQTLDQLNVFQNTNVLSYSMKKEKHSLSVVAGLETFQRETSNNNDQVYVENSLYSVLYRDSIGYNADRLESDFPDNIQSDSIVNQNITESAFNLFSYFTRATYSFDNKYLFTATIRRDGSSKFPENDRWGTFPSFSAGWNLDQEAFFPQTGILTGMKMRAGWGQVGNQDPIAPYRFLSILNPGWSYAFNNQNPSEGFAATFLPASTITWETSEMTNFGVDLYLLDNRLSVTAEFYNKQTEDLLVQNTPSPVFAGAQAPSSNAASMRNDGVELTLDFKQTIAKFNFNIGGNISFVNNEVTSLGAGERIEGAGYESKIILPMTRTVVGGEFGAFYGLKTLGIFQTQEEIDGQTIQALAQPGDVIFQDTNMDGTISPEDAVLIGSPIPDFTYGFYLNAEFKGFDLNASFVGSSGNDIANIFTYYNAGASATENNISVERWENRWSGAGSTNTNPRLTNEPTDNDIFSDRYIEDGSFMRLRNVQLGYTLPKKLYESIGLKMVRLYISADNLLTITNYSGFDPEVGLAFNGDPFGNGVDLGNYPQAQTIIFGTNIKF